MNSTRAATIRLRSSFDGAVSLGRVQTPTLAILARREEEIRAFKPEPYWVVDAAVRAPSTSPPGAPTRAASTPAPTPGWRPPRRRAPSSQACRDQIGHHHQAREVRAPGARAAALRPHLAAARRQRPLRLHRPAHPGRGAAALRGAQGAHLPAHQLALHHRRHGRPRSSRSPSSWAGESEYAAASQYVLGPRRAAAGPGRQRRQGHRPPRDHPHQRRAPPGRQDERGRPPDLRPGGATLPGRLPSRGGVREHARGDDRGDARVPHPRQAPARPRLARRLRRDRRSGRRARRRRGRGPRAAPAHARQGRGRRTSPRSPTRPRRPSRRGATPRARCWTRWRPPASSWTRRSCARP